MADGDFKTLERSAFASIEFPVRRVRVRGSGRHHVHTYAHVHGGDPEKLGRNLYEIEMEVLFTTSATSYPDLWPRRLGLLRQLFEAQHTDDLVIPTIGRMKAFATAWDQETDFSKILNGEPATFRFLEDQSEAFAITNLIQVNSKTVIGTTNVFRIEMEKIGASGDLFDQIQRLGNSLFAFRDQAELGDMLFEAKVRQLVQLCEEADKTVEFFANPRNAAALDALKDLWASASNLADTISGPAPSFGHYVVPQLMTIAQVATAIYGDTSRATELLQLNPIDNAFAVRAGTSVRYFLPDLAERAA